MPVTMGELRWARLVSGVEVKRGGVGGGGGGGEKERTREERGGRVSPHRSGLV